jgi:hypothetical protein
VNRQRAAHVVEFVVAALLTVVITALHFRVMLHAGPLWRDEISSLRIATMPTLAEFWSSLVYDPVPALFFGVLRLWNSLGWGATDEGLRHLGFLIGLGVLGAIWLATWTMKKSPPTWALLLFGLSPVALVWGDSLRAYGLSCLWNILAIGFLWKLISPRPRVANIAVASVAALVSAHSLFPNSLLLFAAGASAIAVAIRHRWWRTAFIILGIGCTAALSLLPYAPIIRQTHNWTGLCQEEIDSAWILTKLVSAIGSGGNLATLLWIGATIFACVALALAMAKPKLLKLTEVDRDLVLFAGGTLLIALATTVGFFRIVGWATSLWFYLPLMGTVAICLDAILKVFRRSIITIFASCLLITVGAAGLTPLTYQATTFRLTNVDLVTRAIAQRAEKSDLVIVDNYFYAISFNRYYHGQAPWLAVPDVNDLSLHRWDLLTDMMRRPCPIQPTLERIDQTLQSGHNVFVVGMAPVTRAATAPPDLPPAPNTASGWTLWPYVRNWTAQVTYTAQVHGSHGMIISVPCVQPISVVENVHAFVVSGWKDRSVAISQ